MIELLEDEPARVLGADLLVHAPCCVVVAGLRTVDEFVRRHDLRR